MQLDAEVDIEEVLDEDCDAIEEEEDFDAKLLCVLPFLVLRSQVAIINRIPPMIIVWLLARRRRLLLFWADPRMILLCVSTDQWGRRERQLFLFPGCSEER